MWFFSFFNVVNYINQFFHIRPKFKIVLLEKTQFGHEIYFFTYKYYWILSAALEYKLHGVKGFCFIYCCVLMIYLLNEWMTESFRIVTPLLCLWIESPEPLLTWSGAISPVFTSPQGSHLCRTRHYINFIFLESICSKNSRIISPSLLVSHKESSGFLSIPPPFLYVGMHCTLFVYPGFSKAMCRLLTGLQHSLHSCHCCLRAREGTRRDSGETVQPSLYRPKYNA